jgi:hypothetical protein
MFTHSLSEFIIILSSHIQSYKVKYQWIIEGGKKLLWKLKRTVKNAKMKGWR